MVSPCVGTAPIIRPVSLRCVAFGLAGPWGENGVEVERQKRGRRQRENATPRRTTPLPTIRKPRGHETQRPYSAASARSLSRVQLLCKDPAAGGGVSPIYTTIRVREKIPWTATSHSRYHTTLTMCVAPLALHHSLSCITGYIGEFEIIDDHRSNKIVIELNGRLNKCGVISPRFDVPVHEIEKWVVNLLPSRQFGHIILSTTYGIMTHEEARRKKTGGKILGFFY